MNSALRLGDFKLKWRRSQFIILMDDGGPCQVDGIIMDAEECFGIHVGVTHFVDVTHLPSGLRVAGFATLGAAVEFVDRVVYLYDWTVPTITLPPAIQAAVHDVITAINTSTVYPHRTVL